MKMPIKLIN